MKDTYIQKIGCFNTILDPYNGITIEKENLPNNKEEFELNLDFLISEVENKRNLIWIYIDINNSIFIPIAISRGFYFHSCSEDYLLVVKKLYENAIVPTGANHTLGVSAVVINKRDELLVIKERISNIGYKLPGGHVDDKELVTIALVREIKEETGIDIEFESIISLGHFYPHQFYKSNFYLLCKAKPLNNKINILDTKEIVDAKWVKIDEYLNDNEVLDYNKILVSVALKNKGFKKENHNILNNIDKNFELFFPY